MVRDDERHSRVPVVDLEADPIELSLGDFADFLGEVRILSRVEARLLRESTTSSVTKRTLDPEKERAHEQVNHDFGNHIRSSR